LLGVVFGALALAIGAACGHAAASRAVPAVVAVVACAVNGLAPQVSWLQPLRTLSPFYQFNGHDPLRNGVSAPAVLVAVETCAVLVSLAAAGFRRRDVASSAPPEPKVTAAWGTPTLSAGRWRPPASGP
jgi:ABC-2 type transport system permease protein